MKREIYHVVYSTDDNYVPHTGISILSLVKNNKNVKFCVWIIGNQISEKNKEKLLSLENEQYLKINIVEFKTYARELKLDMIWSISINAYARLFIPEILPDDIDRVLYLDSDTIIKNDIIDLWNIDYQGNCAAGVLDITSDYTKKALGMECDSLYFNSGVLMLNLVVLRRNDAKNKFLEFINKNNGRVFQHDQGTINVVLEGQIKVLELKYNVMTPIFSMSRDEILDYYFMSNGYYGKDEMLYAKDNAAIIHFTSAFSGRPWERRCTHPLKNEYMKYKRISPWKDLPLIMPQYSIQQKIERWLFTHISIKNARLIVNFLKKIAGREGKK